MIRASAAALAALVLAGCFAPAADDAPGSPAPSTPEGAPPGAPAAVAPEANGTAAPSAPETLTLWFTAERGLATSPPADGTVAERGALFDPRFQGGVETVSPFALAAGLPRSVHVTAMTLDLAFSSDTPQAAFGPAFGFEEVAFFYGADGALSPFLQFGGPATLAPGEVAQATGDVALPPGGWVLEAGAKPEAIVAFLYTQAEGRPMNVHVGAEGSRLTLTALPYAAPPSGAIVDEAFAGEFVANGEFAPSPRPEDQYQDFPVTIPAGTTRFEATLAGASGAPGRTDFDLGLLDATGATVWAAGSPAATETIRLHDVNLLETGVGAFTLRVRNTQSVQGTFTLDVRTTAGATAPAP